MQGYRNLWAQKGDSGIPPGVPGSNRNDNGLLKQLLRFFKVELPRASPLYLVRILPKDKKKRMQEDKSRGAQDA